MSGSPAKSRRNPYLILILADVLAVFVSSVVLSRGKLADTVIGVLVLLLPVVVMLWLVRVIGGRSPSGRRRRQRSWAHVPAAASVLSEGLPAIRLGGAADDRFERRLAIVRRSARYLLLADILVLIFVVNLSSGNVADTATGLLSLSFAVLVVLSLVSVNTRRVMREITVDANAERVFALVADPQRWVRKGGWLGRYRNVDAEPAASGGFKGRATLTALGIPGQMRWEMLEYQPPRHVVTFAQLKWLGIPSLTLASWSIQPTDGAVRVRYEHESRSLGLSLDPTRPLIHGVTGQAVERRLAQLKAEAESPQA